MRDTHSTQLNLSVLECPTPSTLHIERERIFIVHAERMYARRNEQTTTTTTKTSNKIGLRALGSMCQND